WHHLASHAVGGVDGHFQLALLIEEAAHAFLVVRPKVRLLVFAFQAGARALCECAGDALDVVQPAGRSDRPAGWTTSSASPAHSHNARAPAWKANKSKRTLGRATRKSCAASSIRSASRKRPTEAPTAMPGRRRQ